MFSLYLELTPSVPQINYSHQVNCKSIAHILQLVQCSGPGGTVHRCGLRGSIASALLDFITVLDALNLLGLIYNRVRLPTHLANVGVR